MLLSRIARTAAVVRPETRRCNRKQYFATARRICRYVVAVVIQPVGTRRAASWLDSVVRSADEIGWSRLSGHTNTPAFPARVACSVSDVSARTTKRHSRPYSIPRYARVSKPAGHDAPVLSVLRDVR